MAAHACVSMEKMKLVLLNSGLDRVFSFQVVAQKHTNPTSAALIMSLESVFSVIAEAIILHEMMSGREITGCILMFAAIIVTQLPEKKTAEQ